MKRTTEQLVVAAAIRWWKSKRPLAYSHREHLENPRVNTVTDAETRLAHSIAKYLKKKT